MKKEETAAVKTALSEMLRGIQSSRIAVRAKGMALHVKAQGDANDTGKLELALLRRVDGLYLQVHVFGGALNDALCAVAMPEGINNLFTAGVFFLSTLSEKDRRFSPEPGGALLLRSPIDTAAIAVRVAEKIRTIYLPIVESILTVDDELPKIVVEYSEYFSYPLTVLAILKAVGRSAALDDVLADAALRRRFKREVALDFEKIIDKSVVSKLDAVLGQRGAP